MTWRAELTDGRAVVVKQCPYPAEIEADGFAALAAAGVPVPDVLGVAGRTLVMQFVQGTPDWPAVGAAVAGMHRTTGPRYGWHRDNRAGRFPNRTHGPMTGPRSSSRTGSARTWLIPPFRRRSGAAWSAPATDPSNRCCPTTQRCP